MTSNFSVLLSVYSKENPRYLFEALKSVMVQTHKPTELVLVKDGPLTDELETVIDQFNNNFDILKVVAIETNVGLGKALSIGLKSCTYDLVARMDSDDICHPDRFLHQAQFMDKNPIIDIVGGHIEEFLYEVGDSKMLREVPLQNEDIVARLKKRNAMNHVTVMFRKQSVMEAGNYEPIAYLEDYYLWVRMMLIDKKFANIDKVLVFVRTGSGMYKRRGDKSYSIGWRKIQYLLYKNGLISYFQYLFSMFQIKIFLRIPSKIRYFIYKVYLRKKTGKKND